MVHTMKAIEYNTYESIRDQILKHINEAPVIGLTDDAIIPQYPSDLSKFKKPSIVISRVEHRICSTAFGIGYLGQAYDEEAGYYDVHSKYHMMEFQLEVFTRFNEDNFRLTSFLQEDVFGNMVYEFPMYDHTGDGEPEEYGIIQIDDIKMIFLQQHVQLKENKDLLSTIRLFLSIIQTVVPKYETVNLENGIKINQHVIV